MKNISNFLWVVLIIAAAIALSGCGKPSPYIQFGDIFAKTKIGDEQNVQQYVVFTDEKTKKPIGGLKSKDVIVTVGGRRVDATLIPSVSGIGFALLVDQGGSQKHFDESRRLAENILLRLGVKKDKAAILGANGGTPRFVYEEPALAGGKLSTLKRSGKGFEDTFDAIERVKAHGLSGLPAGSKTGTIAIVSGVPLKVKNVRAEEGIPVVVIDVAKTDTAALKSISDTTGGMYILYEPNSTDTIATKAIAQIESVHAHAYSLSFRIKQSEWPLKYSLTLKNGEINSTGDFVSPDITKRWMVVIGIAIAILVIVIVVLIFKRKPTGGPEITRGAKWSDGSPRSPGAPSHYDDDDESTRVGTDAYKPTGGYQSQGYSPPPQSSYGSPQNLQGGGMSQNAGDVTSGAMDVIQNPTVGSSYSPGGGGYASNAGDSTVGDIQAVAPMSGGPPAGVFTALILTVESGSASGREIRVSDRTKLGRGDAYAHSMGAIAFPSDPRISREHAELMPENRAGATFWSVANRSSTNQTYVNDMAIAGTQVLKYNDRIRIGETYLRVLSAPAADGDSTMR